MTDRGTLYVSGDSLTLVYTGRRTGRQISVTSWPGRSTNVVRVTFRPIDQSDTAYATEMGTASVTKEIRSQRRALRKLGNLAPYWLQVKP